MENHSRQAKKDQHLNKIRMKEDQKKRLRQISLILKKSLLDRNEDEIKILEESNSVVKLLESRQSRIEIAKDRVVEREDSSSELQSKCKQLSDAIMSTKSLVVYTGAGISTAAQIPDYRGPNGLWTQLKTGSITTHCDLALAEPTYTHMAITELIRSGLVKHVVSQNCDGLHIRSGLAQQRLSEIHGNMYIEVCSNCKMQYLRDFDVTEKTARHRHKTGRNCHRCPDCDLLDTIVHFGEKGRFQWPLNWEGAGKASDNADAILCLGSSLKILRKYQCLWPKKQKPQLFIVNLQWTPKDSQASLKINGKCDEVMKLVMNYLNIDVPPYNRLLDPIRYFSTPLLPVEEETCKMIKLFKSKKEEDDPLESLQS